MTVCDSCRKPRDVSFSVYPYRLVIQHENLPDHQPQASFVLELCEACAKDLITVLNHDVRQLISRGK